jgi:hypothetical protein
MLGSHACQQPVVVAFIKRISRTSEYWIIGWDTFLVNSFSPRTSGNQKHKPILYSLNKQYISSYIYTCYVFYI